MLLHHNIDNLALDNDNLLGLLICQPLLRPLRGYDMLNDAVSKWELFSFAISIAEELFRWRNMSKDGVVNRCHQKIGAD